MNRYKIFSIGCMKKIIYVLIVFKSIKGRRCLNFVFFDCLVRCFSLLVWLLKYFCCFVLLCYSVVNSNFWKCFILKA